MKNLAKFIYFCFDVFMIIYFIHWGTTTERRDLFYYIAGVLGVLFIFGGNIFIDKYFEDKPEVKQSPK